MALGPQAPKNQTALADTLRGLFLLENIECVADDVKAGKVTSYPQAVKLKKGEVVVTSWATYKSRAHRDKVMKKVMADKRLMDTMDEQMRMFDGMRMMWGSRTLRSER